MNVFEKIFQKICRHNWVQSVEEYIDFDDGVGEHTSTRRVWKCSKCGKVLHMRPPHKLRK